MQFGEIAFVAKRPFSSPEECHPRASSASSSLSSTSWLVVVDVECDESSKLLLADPRKPSAQRTWGPAGALDFFFCRGWGGTPSPPLGPDPTSLRHSSSKEAHEKCKIPKHARDENWKLKIGLHWVVECTICAERIRVQLFQSVGSGLGLASAASRQAPGDSTVKLLRQAPNQSPLTMAMAQTKSCDLKGKRRQFLQIMIPDSRSYRSSSPECQQTPVSIST